jgi:hypothetical protein
MYHYLDILPQYPDEKEAVPTGQEAGWVLACLNVAAHDRQTGTLVINITKIPHTLSHPKESWMT